MWWQQQREKRREKERKRRRIRCFGASGGRPATRCVDKTTLPPLPPARTPTPFSCSKTYHSRASLSVEKVQLNRAAQAAKSAGQSSPKQTATFSAQQRWTIQAQKVTFLPSILFQFTWICRLFPQFLSHDAELISKTGWLGSWVERNTMAGLLLSKPLDFPPLAVQTCSGSHSHLLLTI